MAAQENNHEQLDKDSVRRIGITIGDPAGIGPEIVLKSLSGAEFGDHFVLIGNESVLIETAETLGLSKSLDALAARGGVSFHNINITDRVVAGVESPATGKVSAESIEAAVELWRAGAIDAIATAPISKNALALAGYKYPGHTEFLAELTGTSHFAMSFFADDLRVVLLSTHCSLLEAIAKVKAEPLAELIAFADQQISALLGRAAKIAVAGLNPHASEGGMFGGEEAAEITPAIAACKAKGIDVSGPYSPDTIFLRGYRGEFDAVIACYHDQATIAVKSLSFGSAVNLTLGLPLIRTSVDHGTAFDIAGKGIADASSMTAAIRLASKLAAAKID